MYDGPPSQAAVAVIDEADPAAALLKPIRLEILDHLREPDSAAGTGRALGLPRQRVHYHTRELEKEGFLRHVGDRKKGNCVERLVQASARSYLIAPQALGGVGADPEDVRDRFSSAYLLGSAARTIREVGVLEEAARAAGKRLPTLTLEAEIRFASPADQQAFAEEAVEFFTRMASRYHDEASEGGRSFRLTFTGHPVPRRGDEDAKEEEE